MPIERLAAACSRAGALVFVDGAHALGSLDLNLSLLGRCAQSLVGLDWARARAGTTSLARVPSPNFSLLRIVAGLLSLVFLARTQAGALLRGQRPQVALRPKGDGLPLGPARRAGTKAGGILPNGTPPPTRDPCPNARSRSLLFLQKKKQPGLHPAVISHGYLAGLRAEFAWEGTRDLTGFLALPAALAVFRAIGPGKVRWGESGCVIAGRLLSPELRLRAAGLASRRVAA